MKPGWKFIPTLYFAEGLPYVLVMTLSIIALKKWGIDNERIAFWTSMLSLPWIIKPFFSPVIEHYLNLKRWIVIHQSLLCMSLLCLAFMYTGVSNFYIVMAILIVTAFLSSMHDIAVDGYYIQQLSSEDQAYFAGIRNTFYKLAMIFGQGFLVILAGKLESQGMGVSRSWQAVFLVSAVICGLLSFFHLVCLNPSPSARRQAAGGLSNILISFFKQNEIGWIVSFLLLYRLGEAHIVRVASLFLLDGTEAGGLALETETVGWVYGTFGTVCLFAGGIWAGVWGGRQTDFRKALLWFWAFINLPDLAYIWLALAQPSNVLLIGLGVCVEQFGYGFGFTGYMLALLKFAGHSEFKTAHYSCATGFMALGMMIPGMWSGYLQGILGYTAFFTLALILGFCVLPVIYRIRWDRF